MKAFEYLAVLLSIVLGLGLTTLLGGFARWLELRARVRPYLPALAWAAFLLVAHIQTWWSMFGLRTFEGWTFLQFFVVLLQPIILYLMAALVLPSAASPEPDLKTAFLTHRRWFFGLLLALLAVSLAKDLVIAGRLPGGENLAFHGVMALSALLGILARRDLFQRLIALGALAGISIYIVVLFARLA